jgi:hypothetical protein
LSGVFFTKQKAFWRESTLFKSNEPGEGDTMKARILFVCAKGSSRSMLAASLLLAEAAHHLEVFSTPSRDEQGLILAEQVLHELGISCIAPNRLIQPFYGMHWEEGIVLCSGATDT